MTHRHKCLGCLKFVTEGEELTLGIHQHCVPGYIATLRLKNRTLRNRVALATAASNTDLARRRAAERRLSADGIREPVLLFAHAMEEKLRKNDHKPHWSGASLEFLAGRLDEEVAELDREFLEGDEGFEGDPVLIRGEAVDVANMAMMIFDRARLPPGGNATDDSEE